ncbi:bis(5'-nucleosyl)-tetraphosphatase (asymmetrical), putative [Eimeria tenella]|uniref:Bis(5'-nucleosyl)-tetraphosphatase [asymmetrical] n=1 Tax=Eimeria tenella TaxID=5802 RepID=U6KX54_EIMTE|nr:bis(5'-nucleosyl)-tetraphosphatase (asymmetrical), putative [Eimeria tenella]CDJ40909.1 bis(5'-nucleosyl)-tetraphosphatase (asymmetrical), putative [Eimeria tenella]|eukprot:XP_013231659.1 bis(5'-nucleosyl)-tetraphosphatase (asymmetrical), putative [Eimeria tenella]
MGKAAAVRAGGLLIARVAPPAAAAAATAAAATAAAAAAGHLEDGEDFLAAALRETHEETGLRKEHLKVLSSFWRDLRYEARGKPKQSRYFLAVLENPETPIKISDEHAEYRWVGLKEAQQLSGFEDMQQLLSEANGGTGLAMTKRKRIRKPTKKCMISLQQQQHQQQRQQQ